MASRPFWRRLIRKEEAVSASAINQTLEPERDAYAAGRDVNNNNVNVYVVGGEYIERRIPELARLLRPRPDAMGLIRRAAPDTQLPAQEELPPDPDLEDVLAWLAGLNVSPTELPRPLWTSELARHTATDPAIREELAALAEGWAAEVPGGESQLEDFRSRIESGEFSDGDPCVVVKLDPDRNGGPGYRLTIILSLNGRDGDCQPGSDALLSLDQIKSQLKERLPPLIGPLKQDALTVEFIVPRALLNTDFDQWTISEEAGDAAAGSYRLGAQHAVVLRDLDRMSPLRDRSTWQRRWRRLCDCTDRVPGAIHWVSSRDDYQTLRAALVQDEALGHVCLALAPVADAPVHDLLKAGLLEGMPAMLWLRQPGHSDVQGKRYLRSAFQKSGLVQLPRTVRNMRAKAVQYRRDPAYRGWHLSLLWDNPDRMWEPTLFRLPEPSKNGVNE
jgi:hypothetical protein